MITIPDKKTKIGKSEKEKSDFLCSLVSQKEEGHICGINSTTAHTSFTVHTSTKQT